MTDEAPLTSTSPATLLGDPVVKKTTGQGEPVNQTMETATNGNSTTNGSSKHVESTKE